MKYKNKMQFQLYILIYKSQQRTYKVESSNFSFFENEQLKIEFLIADTDDGKRYQTVIHPKIEIEIVDFFIETFIDYKDAKSIFCNGFQSWTESRHFSKTEKIEPQRKLIRKISEAYGDEKIYTYKNKNGMLHSWTYTYLKLPKKRIQFFGSLNDEIGYTLFEHQASNNKLIIKKDCKGILLKNAFTILDIYVAESYEFICFKNYFDCQQLKPLKSKPAIGWTSWYYYYTNISEKIIEENLDAFTKNNIPIEIFQIDDGWQKSVGDWLHFNDRFPNGLKNIVEKIQEQKIKAGLWIAPFACEHNSFIVKEKPQWILKDDKGKFLKIGFNPAWSYWFYALDFYNSEVQNYLRLVFNTVLNDWNFDMVKLDFLYGTALIERNGKSRGQIMSEAMQFLRECAGDKIILGCGVPLSASIGTTDYCRIGPDIHLKWDFKLLKWIHARERPSTLNAIHNTITRRQLSGNWFWNDPDVFILRSNKNALSFNEKYSLLLVNLLFTSDNISEYNEEQLFWYKSIFPLAQPEDVYVNFVNELYILNFRINDKYYLVLINMSNTSKLYKLPNNLFFDNVTQELLSGNKTIEIPKHASKCLLIVGYTPFAIAGTKGHFFSGTEIENIFLTGNKIELEWKKDVLNPIKVFIKVPKEYEIMTVNNSGKFNRIEKKDFSIIEFENIT
jgi:alpha-galactosidase